MHKLSEMGSERKHMDSGIESEILFNSFIIVLTHLLVQS